MCSEQCHICDSILKVRTGRAKYMFVHIAAVTAARGRVGDSRVALQCSCLVGSEVGRRRGNNGGRKETRGKGRQGLYPRAGRTS